MLKQERPAASSQAGPAADIVESAAMMTYSDEDSDLQRRSAGPAILIPFSGHIAWQHLATPRVLGVLIESFIASQLSKIPLSNVMICTSMWEASFTNVHLELACLSPGISRSTRHSTL